MYVILVVACHDLFQSPTLPCLREPEKGKKHGQIRVKLLFIPCDDTFLGELLSFSYNIATAN